MCMYIYIYTCVCAYISYMYMCTRICTHRCMKKLFVAHGPTNAMTKNHPRWHLQMLQMLQSTITKNHPRQMMLSSIS